MAREINNIETLTLKDLKAKADELGVKYKSNVKKAELVLFIQAKLDEAAASATRVKAKKTAAATKSNNQWTHPVTGKEYAFHAGQIKVVYDGKKTTVAKALQNDVIMQRLVAQNHPAIILIK